MVGISDGYLAVGLSPDNDKMGQDLTTACYYDSGNGQVSLFVCILLCFCLEYKGSKQMSTIYLYHNRFNLVLESNLMF